MDDSKRNKYAKLRLLRISSTCFLITTSWQQIPSVSCRLLSTLRTFNQEISMVKALWLAVIVKRTFDFPSGVRDDFYGQGRITTFMSPVFWIHWCNSGCSTGCHDAKRGWCRPASEHHKPHASFFILSLGSKQIMSCGADLATSLASSWIENPTGKNGMLFKH